MPDIEALVAAAGGVLRPLLEAAYEAGLVAGRAEGEHAATIKLRAKVAELLGDVEPPAASTSVNTLFTNSGQTDSPPQELDRAMPGTVKPAILELLRGSARGMTTRQIGEVTGFKHNSVRGTIWALAKDGDVVKGESGRWLAAPNPNNPIPSPQQLHTEFIGGGRNEPPDAEAQDGSEPGSSDGSHPS